MKSYVIIGLLSLLMVAAVFYYSANPVKCEDCKQGNECSTSYDCGQIGVCYCQYSYETEQETGGGIPANGTCYFE